MHFTGTVLFDFSSYDVWRIYTVLLKASQDRTVTVDVEWRAFTTEDLAGRSDAARGLAACEAVRVAFPEHHEKFVRALLTLVFQERDKPGADKTLAVAAKVAGIEAVEIRSRVDDVGWELLAGSVESARERGVTGVPTIERQGPPVLVKTTGAANYGNAVARLQLIDRMIREDGIWSMSKPS
jgi:hypothetical protein